METLNIRGMLKNSRLSQKIQEKSWHMFTKILEQKAYEHGRKLIHIPNGTLPAKHATTANTTKKT